jgi:hypothetical protein
MNSPFSWLIDALIDALAEKLFYFIFEKLVDRVVGLRDRWIRRRRR